jgi:hypothetical protein
MVSSQRDKNPIPVPARVAVHDRAGCIIETNERSTVQCSDECPPFLPRARSWNRSLALWLCARGTVYRPPRSDPTSTTSDVPLLRSLDKSHVAANVPAPRRSREPDARANLPANRRIRTSDATTYMRPHGNSLCVCEWLDGSSLDWLGSRRYGRRSPVFWGARSQEIAAVAPESWLLFSTGPPRASGSWARRVIPSLW